MGISVVVPVGNNDESWRELIQDFKVFKAEDEVIFVTNTKAKLLEASKICRQYHLKCQIKWLKSQKGRAKQMNFGAQKSKNEILWFLHSDSRVQKSAINELKRQLLKNKPQIYYFRLSFMDDGPRFMKLNNFGVWVRAELMGLPFGDQGYCMHKDIFKDLGGFSEQVSYGEDHLFIWKAHQTNVTVTCLKNPLYTSSRKYKKYGWFNTTLKHLYLTYKQAIPEFLKLLSSKVRS